MSPNSIDWAAVAAWLGAVVAVIGAFYTRSQARSAKKSLRLSREAKDAAVDQAHSARDSAHSASIAKDAAVDQARSAAQAVEVARAALHGEDCPQFDITAEQLTDSHLGPDTVRVTVRLLSGPPTLHVDLWWTADSTVPIDVGPEHHLNTDDGQGHYELIRNSAITFAARLFPGAVRAAIKVTLHCTEADGEHRIWPHAEIVEWQRRDP